jgi:hypothetical protein
MPDEPVFVTATEKESDCPATTARTSGVDEVREMPTPFTLPRAERVPPFSV